MHNRKHFAYGQQKQGCLLGMRTGVGGKGAREWRLDCVHWHGRPRRLWTATRTMEVLRQCPLAIVQQLVFYTTAVSTTVLGQSHITHKDKVRCEKHVLSNCRWRWGGGGGGAECNVSTENLNELPVANCSCPRYTFLSIKELGLSQKVHKNGIWFSWKSSLSLRVRSDSTTKITSVLNTYVNRKANAK